MLAASIFVPMSSSTGRQRRQAGTHGGLRSLRSLRPLPLLFGHLSRSKLRPNIQKSTGPSPYTRPGVDKPPCVPACLLCRLSLRSIIPWSKLVMPGSDRASLFRYLSGRQRQGFSGSSTSSRKIPVRSSPSSY